MYKTLCVLALLAGLFASTRTSADGASLECLLETKAATIVEFIQGLHGTLSLTLEEGTSAAWLHDLLKPHVSPARGLRSAKDRGGAFSLTSLFIELIEVSVCPKTLLPRVLQVHEFARSMANLQVARK